MNYSKEFRKEVLSRDIADYAQRVTQAIAEATRLIELEKKQTGRR